MSALLAKRKAWRKQLDLTPQAETEQAKLAELFKALEQERSRLLAELAKVGEVLRDARLARDQLMATACPSKAEHDLTNEIQEKFGRLKPKMLRMDNKKRMETERTELDPMYERRKRLIETRLDPEQCAGGRNFWEPPKEDLKNAS